MQARRAPTRTDTGLPSIDKHTATPATHRPPPNAATESTEKGHEMELANQRASSATCDGLDRLTSNSSTVTRRVARMMTPT